MIRVESEPEITEPAPEADKASSAPVEETKPNNPFKAIRYTNKLIILYRADSRKVVKRYPRGPQAIEDLNNFEALTRKTSDVSLSLIRPVAIAATIAVAQSLLVERSAGKSLKRALTGGRIAYALWAASVLLNSRADQIGHKHDAMFDAPLIKK